MTKQEKIRLLSNIKSNVELSDIISCGSKVTFFIVKTIRNNVKMNWYFMDIKSAFDFIVKRRYKEFYIFRAKTSNGRYKIKQQMV